MHMPVGSARRAGRRTRTGQGPWQTEMEHGPVSTEFASTRLAFAVSDPVTNADDTVTLDVAYADSQGTKHERVTPPA